MKNLTKIGGVTAVVAALTLTAGGGGGGAAQGPETAKGQDAGSDLAKLVSVNAKEAKDLQPGGTVTLPLGNIGPDFNGFSNNGNSADNTALHRPIDQAGTWGCWNFDFDGTATPNKDFCEDVKSDVKDGKQTITIKVNEKATYNDGTP
ncbi:MAG TPA: ABC transporter family substrate-binding protein, partial [Arthrobacter sp.]|nr:ABC transporter family substrate-binding protein [Arthrobacter sp.]